jgi:hypothetical protein
MSVRIFKDMPSKFDYISVDAHHYLCAVHIYSQAFSWWFWVYKFMLL